MPRIDWIIIWLCVVVALVGGIGALALDGVAIEPGHAGPVIGGIALWGAVATPIAMRGQGLMPRVAAAGTGIALFLLICAAATFCSYAVAARAHGYWDEVAAAADALVGFDWLAAHRWEVAHPGLIPLARWLYSSIGLTPFVLIPALAAGGHDDRLRRFLAAYGVSLCITVVLFALFPLRSPILHFIGPHPDYLPYAGLRHVAAIEAMRAGTLHELTYGTLAGLVGFPSFHVISAILFMWASLPLKLLRGPLLAINAGMIAATPMEGAHYLIDVLAGMAIAWGVIAWLCRPAPRPESAVEPVGPTLAPA